jgi:lipid II isoglutaminyl synthase (glutamine-hydrolysing)
VKRPDPWTRAAVAAGRTCSSLSRRLGSGEGAIIGGRVTALLAPGALARLSRGRRVVLVSGTNGKTTTSHLLAAALRESGAVAHNNTGANMADGALVALCADQDAPTAVLEVDELHLASVAAQVRPAVIVLLNLSRDQLDRGSEVRAVRDKVASALRAHPDATVVANADDPLVVAAARAARTVVWVSTGVHWNGDSLSCPDCGASTLGGPCTGSAGRSPCGDAPAAPRPRWALAGSLLYADDRSVELRIGLPGRFNLANTAMAVAAAEQLGVAPDRAAEAMTALTTVAGRYASFRYGAHRVRLLLAKNPAGWTEALDLLDPARPVLLAVNAREADGRDTSWLWDVPFEELRSRDVVTSGERAADLSLRLTYAEVHHHLVADPLAGLRMLPAGGVDVVANYTAFQRLRALLERPGPAVEPCAPPVGETSDATNR